ncbi:MAG: restriction endonuclease subunit S [Candidatus Marinimicrobia bacterium]|nr:restriction endonuclease subunit S [Candidatus Neomarinimicrobiota bacterium]
MTRHGRLGRFIDIRTGYLSRTKVEETPDGRYCLLQLSDFDDTRTSMDPRNLTRFDPGELRKDQTIQPGELIFLAKGVNNFAYHPGPLPVPTLAASYFFVLTPSSEIIPEYLNWFLNHRRTTRAFDRIAGVGARMPVIKKSDLADIDILLPPLSDQQKIVELHTLMTREARLLDQLRDHRKTFIDTVTMAIAQGEKGKDTNHV